MYSRVLFLNIYIYLCKPAKSGNVTCTFHEFEQQILTPYNHDFNQ